MECWQFPIRKGLFADGNQITLTLGKEAAMNFSHIQSEPVIALLAGILILLMPRLLNYVVAIYLIIIGILGLTHGLRLF